MKKENIIFLSCILVVIVTCIIFALVIGDGKKKPNKSVFNDEKTILLAGKHYVTITVKDYGKIKVELDADVAPITVTNFIDLVNKGFYDGLTFHRIQSGFMIQGGGYDINGERKISTTIKGEFKNNGVYNTISHTRGVISMARATSNDSASTEFFIVHEDSTQLDGNYAAFGHVISGMDVVDKIVKKAKTIDERGTVSLENRPVIESIKVTE